MLVLTRRREQTIYLDFSSMTDAELLALRSNAPISVSVVDVRGDKIRLGFDAPPSVKIDRKEIYDREQLAKQPVGRL
jgi:carbon storage regulator CsrA